MEYIPGLYNMDCMEAMKQFPDKYFELAIVDPPYGGGYTADNSDGQNLAGGVLNGKQERAPVSDGASTVTISATRTGGTWAAKYKQGGIFSDADITHWDIAPPKEYFQELARVSKNQIIWGGNYFDLPPTRCFLVWYKHIPENFTMAMCEYAWTSFNDNAKLFACSPQGTVNEKRFHPTQKPVKLYSWILDRYAKQGYKILDTHAGSASLGVACHYTNLPYYGYEIDPEYYRMASERLQAAQAQTTIFEQMEE